MKKYLSWVLYGLLGLLALAQFIRPEYSNPSVNPADDIQQVAGVPAEVMTVLRSSCYDCHSNETVYPWYSKIAPVSWWVVDHVQEGREKLNFSTFGQLNAGERADALEEAGETIQEGEMPLRSYTWLHPGAKLSAANKSLLLNWLQANGGEQGEGGGGPASETAGDDDDD
ncbi:MAG: heme-binding domain-containing protein [Saprospiraceae bacterium]|nr:heme-binding domain-containing protein [Saprospiraceae bacterium]